MPTAEILATYKATSRGEETLRMERVSTFDVYVLQPVTDVDVHHTSKHREKAAAAAPSPSIHGWVLG